MSDPLIDATAKGFEFILAGIVAILAWIGKRTINRVDDVEHKLTDTRESYVKKKELTETVNSLREEIRQQHSQISNQIDKSSTQQTALIEKQFILMDRQAARIDDLHLIMMSRADEKLAQEVKRRKD